jgi:hypothetical protein
MSLDTILKEMISGVDPPPDEDTKSSLRAAMKAFSLDQLQQMNNAGVRFWPIVKGVPPEYEEIRVADLAAPAEYLPLIRLFRISPATLKSGTGGTDALRHELAHAWDDVRNEKKPPNLRKLKGKAVTDEVQRLGNLPETFGSESSAKLDPSKLSMKEMLDRYKRVLRVDKDMSFAHPTTASKHLAANVMEFYAEGYSVFHGYNDDRQSRLLRLAKELYDYLEKESTTYGLPPLDRKGLSDQFNKTYPGWKSF